MCENSKTKCCLGLYTRVKDMRNFCCNLAHELDLQYNVNYSTEDENEKLRIFNTPNSKTDFTNGNKLTGVGDHLYPICKDRVKMRIIGSDTLWNRIPVSGYNQKYKENENFKVKVDCWEEYCKKRGAILYYPLSDKVHNDIIKYQEELVDLTKTTFDRLKVHSPSVDE